MGRVGEKGAGRHIAKELPLDSLEDKHLWEDPADRPMEHILHLPTAFTATLSLPFPYTGGWTNGYKETDRYLRQSLRKLARPELESTERESCPEVPWEASGIAYSCFFPS